MLAETMEETTMKKAIILCICIVSLIMAGFVLLKIINTDKIRSRISLSTDSELIAYKNNLSKSDRLYKLCTIEMINRRIMVGKDIENCFSSFDKWLTSDSFDKCFKVFFYILLAPGFLYLMFWVVVIPIALIQGLLESGRVFFFFTI